MKPTKPEAKPQSSGSSGGFDDTPSWAKKLPSVARFDYATMLETMKKDNMTTEAKVDAAQNEHVRKQMPFAAGQEQMSTEYGWGCVYFFDFIKFIAIGNLFLVVLQAINYTLFAVKEKPGFTGGNTTGQGDRAAYADFFITAYTDEQATGWYALNIVSLIYCLVASPLYYAIMKRRIPEDAAENAEITDRIIRFNNNCTIDVGYYYRGNVNLFFRRLASVLIFLLLIMVQVIGSWFITKNEQDSGDLGTAFGIAILVSVLNILYTFIARVVTEFEKWMVFGNWKRSLALKLIFFKLANIVTVYAAKDYKSLADNICVYDIIGEQFLTLLIVETLVMNVWEVVFTLVHAANFRFYARITGSITGDADNLPQFDLALEYLEIIYRQYLSILSMVVFPLSIAFAAVGFFIEFWVDKLRLFKICGKPRHMHTSQKEFLAMNLALVAIVSFFTPYAGSVWVMAGWTRDQSDLCHFP